MGSKKDDGGRQALLNLAQQQTGQALKQYEGMETPDIAAQRLGLSVPELVGLLESGQLSDTQLAEISTDPRLRASQMRALQEMETRATEGMTSEEKALFNAERRRRDADLSAQQQSIQRSLAERGVSGGGLELAAKMQAAQSAANRAQSADEQMAAQALSARRQALAQAGQMAGGLESQDYARQAQLAQARDAIAQFNLQNKQGVSAANLAAQQNIANLRAQTSNAQQQANKALLQNDFENRMRIANAKAGTLSGSANLLTQQAAMQKPTGGGTPWGAIGTIGGAVGGGFLGSVIPGLGTAAGATVGATAGGALGGAAEQRGYAEGGIVEKDLGKFAKNTKINKYDEHGTTKEHNYLRDENTNYLRLADGGISTNSNINPDQNYGRMTSFDVRSPIATPPSVGLNPNLIPNYTKPELKMDALQYAIDSKPSPTQLKGNMLTTGGLADLQSETKQNLTTTKPADSGMTGSDYLKIAGMLAKSLPKEEKKEEFKFTPADFSPKKYAEGGIVSKDVGKFKDNNKSNAYTTSANLSDFSAFYGDGLSDSEKEYFQKKAKMDYEKLSFSPIGNNNDQAAKRIFKFADGGVAQEQQQMQMPINTENYPPQAGTMPTYEDGGLAEVAKLMAKKRFESDGNGDIVNVGDSTDYADDRLDAKLNDKEMVLNVEQQQRLMDLLKGQLSPEEMPNGDLVRPATPEETNLGEDVKSLEERIAMLEAKLGE